MSSRESQELFSQPGPGSNLGALGANSGGGSSGRSFASHTNGVFSAADVSLDPGTILDFNSLMTNAVAPLLLEIKKLQKENRQQTVKLEAIQNQVTVTHTMLKEMKETVDKEKKPIKALLKLEGMEEFKKRVWQSMHLRSDMEEEEGIWTELIRRLRENEWLACDSARDVGNLLRCFHEERSVLKQQVPDRMNKDFSNKSAETAVALTKTFAYLNTRGLGRLKGTDLLLMYQLAYVKCQYLNQKVPVVDGSSKTIRSRAEQDLWEVVYKRTQKSTCNVEEMKTKIKEALKNGFKPHK